jgi:hypothetical protein
MKPFYIAVISSILAVSFAAPATALFSRSPERKVTCWFFRGEKVEFKQTCIFDKTPGRRELLLSLTWEDNVETLMKLGDLKCPGSGHTLKDQKFSIDNACGKQYPRYPETLKRIPENVDLESIAERRLVWCAQANGSNNSVCYRFDRDR